MIRLMRFSALVFTIFAMHAYANTPASRLVKVDEVSWGYLNPLRGDKSPRAANLWGDRRLNTATGMLVAFDQGFSSPAHIHNVSYRGIVIEGLLHNDDPNADKLWMPTGSFWTQPAGANHITAANGATNLIYLEIDSGPYLVNPSSNKFDNGEAPLNLHVSNLVWHSSAAWVSKDGSKVEQSYLWGSPENGELGGALIKLPRGFDENLTADAEEFRAVVIAGQLVYKGLQENSAQKSLAPGSYFSASGKHKHRLKVEEQTILYIRTNGSYGLSPG